MTSVEYDSEIFVTSCIWRIEFGGGSHINVLGNSLEEAIKNFRIGMKEEDIEVSPYTLVKVEQVGALNDFWNWNVI